MRSGARSGSDGSTSVEEGRRVGASMKPRLAQPPRIVGVFGALRPSARARWVWRELYANYPSARHGWDGAKQWPWADRSISNRRKPRDSDRDVPSCVVTYPYPAKNISNLVPWKSPSNFHTRGRAGGPRSARGLWGGWGEATHTRQAARSIEAPSWRRRVIKGGPQAPSMWGRARSTWGLGWCHPSCRAHRCTCARSRRSHHPASRPTRRPRPAPSWFR